jgi:hypothetical protein
MFGNHKCKYRVNCDCYEESSATCNTDLDKSYCGIYRRFDSKEIKVYIRDW